MTVFVCERVGCDNEMRPTIHIIRIGATLIDVCDDCNKEIEDAVTAIVKTPPANKIEDEESEQDESLFPEELEKMKETYLAIKPGER